MSIFVGFDGGGTYSRYIIQKDDLPPTLHHIEDSIKPSETSVEHTAARLLHHLDEILRNLRKDILGICISISGAGSNITKEAISNIIAAELHLSPENVLVESDSLFGLEASYQGDANAGIFCIIGTGSVITARTFTNKILKIGGWGKEFGDQGSAHAIGVESIRYYCQATDEVAHRGILYDKVTAHLEEQSGYQEKTIREYIYSGNVYASKIARITLANTKDDNIAKSIVFRAISDIVDTITTFYDTHKDQLPAFVTLHGGLLQTPAYQEQITDELESRGFQVQYLGTAHLLDYCLKKAKQIAR